MELPFGKIATIGVRGTLVTTRFNTSLWPWEDGTGLRSICGHAMSAVVMYSFIRQATYSPGSGRYLSGVYSMRDRVKRWFVGKQDGKYVVRMCCYPALLNPVERVEARRQTHTKPKIESASSCTFPNLIFSLLRLKSSGAWRYENHICAVVFGGLGIHYSFGEQAGEWRANRNHESAYGDSRPGKRCPKFSWCALGCARGRLSWLDAPRTCHRAE